LLVSSPSKPAQAHDFEAYQEMLAAQAGLSGAPAAGERYEQISKFLAGGCCSFNENKRMKQQSMLGVAGWQAGGTSRSPSS